LGATIGQPVQAAVLVAIEDLVARFSGDIEFTAQRGHFLPGEEPGHEPKALVHHATLLPRHFALPAKARSVTYVSGMRCNLSLGKVSGS
jgi:hypothetical protein